jgi:hypothetical protein
VNKSNTAVLVDQTGNQVFELHPASGVDLRKFVGKRATVTGTVNASATPMQGANQVITVTGVAAGTGGDCAPVAARIGATTTAAGIAAGAGAAAAGAGAAAGAAGAGAAAAGVSAAVVGGVVAAAGAAAVVGGLAASGTFSTTSP